ncbi:MAG: GYD domain-containing protein [Acidobacteria bacterium]|nr:GYD domain-containing protein [Acidobacteriota bacterium]
MPKFLAKARYNADGARALMKEGGSSRVAAVTKAAKAIGGRIESFYFAYGGADAFVIVDAPNEAAALALSLAVNASGSVTLEMVPLITPKQMDDAAKVTVKYRAPGA